MRKRGIGKVFGFLFGFVLVAGAAAGIYFSLRNQNSNNNQGGKVDPVNPDNPDIIIPVDDDKEYTYTDAERIALEDSFKKTQGIDYETDEEIPERGSEAYAEYQIKLAVSESLPIIFSDNNVSNESLAKIVAYLNDDNIDFSLDLSKLLKIVSVDKDANSSSTSATVQISIFEIVNQVTETINNIAKVNEYNTFGLSSNKLASIITDVIGQTLEAKASIAKDYKKLHNDELLAATKNVDTVKNSFENLYINGKTFDGSKQDSFYTKLYNTLFDEQLINGLVDEYYETWADAVKENGRSGVIYYGAQQYLENGYDNFAALKDQLENDAEDHGVNLSEDYEGYQIVLALFYEDNYEEYFKNDLDAQEKPITKKTVVTGLLQEYLAEKELVAGNVYFDNAKDVESIKDYVTKIAKKAQVEVEENNDYFPYLKLDRMINDVRKIYNNEYFQLDLGDMAEFISKVACKIGDRNYYTYDYDLDRLNFGDDSDVYRFLQDWGPGLGLSDILGGISFDEYGAGYLVYSFSSAIPESFYMTVYAGNDEYQARHEWYSDDDQELIEEKTELFIALLKDFKEEFRAAGTEIYTAQNDLLVTLLKIFGNDVSKTISNMYSKIQPALTKLVSLEIKIASAGAKIISVLDTSELKDLLTGIATGDYDHEYVAQQFADKLSGAADDLKSKLSPSGVLIDMTEEEIREAVDQGLIYPIRSIYGMAYSLGLVDMVDIEVAENVEDLAAYLMEMIQNRGQGANPLELLYPIMKIANQVPAYASRFTGAYNQLYNGLIAAFEFVAKNAQNEDEYFSADYLSDVLTALVNDVKEEKSYNDAEYWTNEENNDQNNNQQEPEFGKNLKEVFSDARFPLMLLKTFVAFAEGADLGEPEYRYELLPGETTLPSKGEQYIEANKEFFDLAALFMKVTGIGVEVGEDEEQQDIVQTITSALNFLMSDMVSKDSTVIDDTIEEMRPTQLKFVDMLFILTELFETVDDMDLTVQEIGEDGEITTRGLTYDELILQLVSDKLRDYVAGSAMGQSVTGELLLLIGEGDDAVEKTYYYRVEADEEGFQMYVWDEDNNYIDVSEDSPFSVIYGELLNEVNNMVVETLSGMFDVLPNTVGSGIDMVFNGYLEKIFALQLPFEAKNEIIAVIVDMVKDYTEGFNIATQVRDYLIMYLMYNMPRLH